ncbi:MAG: alkaline phosphatase family protein [Phycisphaerae bacterium]
MRIRYLVLALILLLPPPVRAGSVTHVIHISVDGLPAGLLHDLLANDSAGDFANFQRFVDEGATTFNARADHGNTTTLPNHTTMVTGRPVILVGRQPNTIEHGYIGNDMPDFDETLHNAGNAYLGYVASVFDVVHDHGLSTALYVSKSKFCLIDQTYNGAPNLTGPIADSNKIDSFVTLAGGSPATASDLNAAYLADLAVEHFGYTLLHYRDPDTVGHLIGWGTDDWNDSVAAVDRYLGSLFKLIQRDPVLAGHTAIILTSDHGGSGIHHRDPTLPAHYTIPFFVWGPEVEAGADLYELNRRSRTNPGTDRPDYLSPDQPIRNGDAANLALNLLGLGPIPGSFINATQNLVVPEPGCVSLLLAGAALLGARRRRTRD